VPEVAGDWRSRDPERQAYPRSAGSALCRSTPSPLSDGSPSQTSKGGEPRPSLGVAEEPSTECGLPGRGYCPVPKFTSTLMPARSASGWVSRSMVALYTTSPPRVLASGEIALTRPVTY